MLDACRTRYEREMNVRRMFGRRSFFLFKKILVRKLPEFVQLFVVFEAGIFKT